ncbi:MAG: GAF domain-containing protein [Armatimonadota bacterium]
MAKHCAESPTAVDLILSEALAVLPCASLHVVTEGGVSEIDADLAKKALSSSRPRTIRPGARALPFSGGALVCISERFVRGDWDFLSSVAHLVSICMAHSTEQRLAEMEAVYEISQAIEHASIDQLLNLITEKASRVMGAQACSLMLKSPGTDELVIRASYGLSDEIVEETRVRIGEGVAGRVAETGTPMLLADLAVDPRFAGVASRSGIVSSICVPLKDEEGRVYGVLNIRRKPPAQAFTEDDTKLFSVLASQASLAIGNSRLYGKLKTRVRELSVLYNAVKEFAAADSVSEAASALVEVVQKVIGGSALFFTFGLDAELRAAAGISPRTKSAVLSYVYERQESLRNLKSPRAWRDSAFPWGRLIPLISEGEFAGLLVVGGAKPEEESLRLVKVAASQAATVIRHLHKREEQIGQKVLELSALYDLTKRIGAASTMKETFDSVLDVVSSIVPSDESFIWTVDSEKEVFEVQARRGGDCEEHFEGAKFPIDTDGLLSRLAREKSALVLGDVHNQPLVHEGCRDCDMRSLMAIPLVIHDEVIGVMGIRSRQTDLYTEEHLRTLSVVATQAAALYTGMKALDSLANYTDNILLSIDVGVATLDQDGRVLTWNRAAEEISRIPAGSAVGRPFSELAGFTGLPVAEQTRLVNAARRVLETGQRFAAYKEVLHPINRDALYLNVSASRLRGQSGEILGLVLIFEDMTERMQMENEMRRVSELAAIGQLAANIAHEIRNPLSSIKGAAQYLHREYEDHAALAEFLDIIIDEVNVLNGITTDFLDFARPSNLNLAMIGMAELVEKTLQFMHPEIESRGIVLEKETEDDMPKIYADERQLEEAFRNIILNALHAMPKGGTLSVHAGRSRRGVAVTIADTGVGIPDGELSQIFVPFFTTKPKGTGLGLSIVKKIVDNHGGRVWAESTPGEGAKFIISLPVCGEKAKKALMEAGVEMEQEIFGRSGRQR